MGTGYNDYSTRWRIGLTMEQYLTLNGKIWYVEYYDAALANGSTVTLGLSIPTTFYPRGFVVGQSDEGIMLDIKEGATYTGGSALTAINMDRNSANADHMTFVSNPTVTNEGTLLMTNILGSASANPSSVGAPGLCQCSPIAYKLNTKYVIKIINFSGDASRIKIGLYFTEQAA